MSSSQRNEDLEQQARAWLVQEPDPANRGALERMLADGATDELASCFSGPLVFGTAGLRGLLGPGPSRMNEITVARAAAGVARQALADVEGAAERGIVLARDGRHGGGDMVRAAAEILAGHGLRVHLFTEPTPTPVAAFACLHLGAAGACVVTASHNPPGYNGFKVYSHRGSQIVSPQDARIRSEADGAGPYAELPRLPMADAVRAGLVSFVGDEVGESYLSSLDAQCLGASPPPASVRMVTTALHGVGHRWIDAALRRRGHADLHPVRSQMEPDGSFPTVAFPNPEEEGALDLALQLGREVSADLLVANDPDTDRLCLAVQEPGEPSGYRVLSGDAVGLLLADWIHEGHRLAGTLPEEPLMVTSIVSTSRLADMMEGRGVRVEETLTGFKWIWDRALAATDEGLTFLFGFEEALGYCVGPAVRDKDGIGAAVLAAEMAADAKSRGQTLLDRLEAIERSIGPVVTRQVVATLDGADGPARLARVMGGLRDTPPGEIGGMAVARVRDLQGPDADALGLARSNVWTCWTAEGHRLIVRPSGTEPKLKVYIEIRRPGVGEGDLASQRQGALGDADRIEAWVRARLEG